MRAFPALLSALALAAAGCDAGGPSRPASARLALGAAGEAVAVGPDADARTAWLGPDAAEAAGLPTVVLDLADVAFAPTSAATASGHGRVFVLVGGYPVLQALVTVDGGAVTAVAPAALPVGTFSPTDLDETWEALDAAVRPALAAGVDRLPPATVALRVGAALRDGPAAVAVVAHSTTDLDGRLTVRALTFRRAP